MVFNNIVSSPLGLNFKNIDILIQQSVSVSNLLLLQCGIPERISKNMKSKAVTLIYVIIMGWLTCKVGSRRLLIVDVRGRILMSEGEE
jgi:hypothetical protein